ncbi:PfkB family carbohydrate kinase [Fictibacillus enclensis]|uniref:bifunctional heptose 7-phosphate kinase/heptose 1-phosphate adenyltransferase n=1 Tax=Fictibacillus enclensis TaxID=1017270 RepID=UPI0025A016C6|nr:PfkB family carbohydrate kinase [Fictibacillus enclensis]MDM5335827.1 PfkB family carbohydrate kinase [Fictibacillus enclensis]
MDFSLDIKQRIEEFKSRVIVIGDVILDQYIQTEYTYSDHEQVKKYNVQENLYFPGNAANVAINLHSLGLQPHLIGIIGDDPAANILINTLQGRVNTKYLIKNEGCSTSLKSRFQCNGLTHFRVDNGYSLTLTPFLRHQIRKHILSILKSYEIKIIILADNGEGTLDPLLIKEVCNLANSKGISVITDPSKNTDFKSYTSSSVLVPNLEEFNELTQQHFSTARQAIPYAQSLLEGTNLHYIILKDSERGSYLVTQHKGVLYCPALSSTIQSSVGAGDSFISMLAVSELINLPLDVSFRLSNLAAAISVQKPFTSAVTLDDLDNQSHSIDENLSYFKEWREIHDS